MNNLSGCHRDNRADQFGLGVFVEFHPLPRATFIIGAHGTNITKFAIDIGLIGSNVANNLAKLFDAVTVFGVLEADRVNYKAILGVLNQDTCSPTTKRCSLR